MKNQKSTTVAYVLNILFPGIGTIYFGRLKMGIFIFVLFLLALFLLVFGASAGMLGIAIIILSIILALFTAGFSLLVGLPVGILLLLMGAGALVSVLIWAICIVISEIVVYKENKKNNL